MYLNLTLYFLTYNIYIPQKSFFNLNYLLEMSIYNILHLFLDKEMIFLNVNSYKKLEHNEKDKKYG